MQDYIPRTQMQMRIEHVVRTGEIVPAHRQFSDLAELVGENYSHQPFLEYGPHPSGLVDANLKEGYDIEELRPAIQARLARMSIVDDVNTILRSYHNTPKLPLLSWAARKLATFRIIKLLQRNDSLMQKAVDKVYERKVKENLFFGLMGVVEGATPLIERNDQDFRAELKGAWELAKIK